MTFSEDSLKQVRKLQSTLKGHGFLTDDLVAKYDHLLKQAECGREVAWADNPPVPSALHQEFLQHLLLPSSGFLAPLPLSGQDVEDAQLATYCSDSIYVNEECSVQIPSTPSKNIRQPYCDTLMSPGISSQLSPIYIRERPNLRNSPHPVNLAKLNTQELLDLINNDQQPIRRSLEENFMSSPQITSSNPPVNWPGPPEKLDLHNLTFSPMNLSGYNRHHAFLESTPSTDRVNLAGSTSFTISQDPHTTGNNTFNSNLLPDATYCTHLEMIPTVSSSGCQQMHVQKMQDYCIHEAVPQCGGGCRSKSGPNILLAKQRASCMLPPNPVCRSTVPKPRQQLQQDHYRGPSAQRYKTTKENMDPHRNFKRTASGIQRDSVTPINRKYKTVPVWKTGK